MNHTDPSHKVWSVIKIHICQEHFTENKVYPSGTMDPSILLLNLPQLKILRLFEVIRKYFLRQHI